MKTNAILLVLVLCTWGFVLSYGQSDAKVLNQWVFDEAHIDGRTVKAAQGNQDAKMIGTVEKREQPAHLTFDGGHLLVSEKGEAVSLPQRAFSVEAWVRLDSGTRWGCLIGYQQDNGSYEKGWLLGYNDTHFVFAVSSTGSLTYLASRTPFRRGKWHHVVGIFDGPTMRIFVDGEMENRYALESAPIDYADAYYVMGAYKDDDEFYPMDGSLHEITVHDSPLTKEDVKARYQRKVALFPGNVELAFGPYLEFVDPGTAVVRWHTTTPSPSVITYGQHTASELRVTDPEPKTVHELKLADLKPNTIYRYVIEVYRDDRKYVTPSYECDTFFNYSRAVIPDQTSPYDGDDGAPAYVEAAEHILRETGISEGYCVILGVNGGQLTYELAARSQLQIVGAETDHGKVVRARKRLLDAGIYGSRVTIQHVDSFSDLPFTALTADLVVTEAFTHDDEHGRSAAEVYRLLRPGGVAYLGGPRESMGLSRQELEQWLSASSLDYEIAEDNRGLWAKMVRAPVLGSGRWSHEYGGPDNSANSQDTLSGAGGTHDLQVQWIGKPGPRSQADRSGRKPAPLAINGRLFVQGLHRIIALNAHNGLILWSLEIPGLERFNIPRDSSNWCADAENVFIAVRGECWRLDAATGQLSMVYPTRPASVRDWEYDWGYVGRWEDKLFGSSVKKGSAFTNFWGGAGWYDARSGSATYKVCSDQIYALSRNDGKLAWAYENGVIINSTITLGDGRICFVECRNNAVKAADSRQVGMKELWQDQFLVALDAHTGDLLWEQPIDTEDGTVLFHLAYADDKLYLGSSGTEYHLYTYDVRTGMPGWQANAAWGSSHHGGHMSRPAITGGKVFLRPYVLDADTGKTLDIKMPGGGCGTYAASANAMIFRAGNVTMWNLTSQETTSWHRLRPGCWLSTIPACGLLLSPEAGGGCSCGSWMETSIAFAPTTGLGSEATGRTRR